MGIVVAAPVSVRSETVNQKMRRSPRHPLRWRRAVGFVVFTGGRSGYAVAMAVTLSDIRAAQRRIAGGVYVSPCPESIPLSEITGTRIVCKLDNLQRTGSFKERGARNALLRLSAAQKKRASSPRAPATTRSVSPTTDGCSAFRSRS